MELNCPDTDDRDININKNNSGNLTDDTGISPNGSFFVSDSIETDPRNSKLTTTSTLHTENNFIIDPTFQDTISDSCCGVSRITQRSSSKLSLKLSTSKLNENYRVVLQKCPENGRKRLKKDSKVSKLAFLDPK